MSTSGSMTATPTAARSQDGLEQRLAYLEDQLCKAVRQAEDNQKTANYWWVQAGEHCQRSHALAVALVRIHDLLEAGEYRAARDMLSSVSAVSRASMTAH